MIAVDWRRDVRPNPKQLLQQHFDGTDCGDRPHIISNLARDGGAPPSGTSHLNYNGGQAADFAKWLLEVRAAHTSLIKIIDPYIMRLMS